LNRIQRRARGMTLIEVMVSMTVLLIGLLGMMRLQVWGLTSNQGARAHTQATQLARELANALAQLPFGDPRLAKTSHFGSLLEASGTVLTSGVAEYTAFTPLPGVTAEAAIEAMDDVGTRAYQRRWTVSVQQAAGRDAVKYLAISVVYRERSIGRWREVVVYAPNVNRGLLTANLPAN
jgi:type IV pilus assembly protein PilV